MREARIEGADIHKAEHMSSIGDPAPSGFRTTKCDEEFLTALVSQTWKNVTCAYCLDLAPLDKEVH